MMQLVSSHGIVLLEREKPRPASSKNATLDRKPPPPTMPTYKKEFNN